MPESEDGVAPAPTAPEFAFRFGGRSMYLADLPLETLDEIAKRLDEPWYMLTGVPLKDAAAAMALARACAQYLKVEIPERPTARQITAMFDMVESLDLPDGYSDGIPNSEAVRTTE